MATKVATRREGEAEERPKTPRDNCEEAGIRFPEPDETTSGTVVFIGEPEERVEGEERPKTMAERVRAMNSSNVRLVGGDEGTATVIFIGEAIEPEEPAD